MAATFIETFAQVNAPEHLQAHVAREFTAEAVKRTLEDARSTTWWLLDDVPNKSAIATSPGIRRTELRRRRMSVGACRWAMTKQA